MLATHLGHSIHPSTLPQNTLSHIYQYSCLGEEAIGFMLGLYWVKNIRKCVLHLYLNFTFFAKPASTQHSTLLCYKEFLLGWEQSAQIIIAVKSYESNDHLLCSYIFHHILMQGRRNFERLGDESFF